MSPQTMRVLVNMYLPEDVADLRTIEWVPIRKRPETRKPAIAGRPRVWNLPSPDEKDVSDLTNILDDPKSK